MSGDPDPVRIDLGDGVVVRSWRETDEASLIENANDPGIARNLRDSFPSPYTVEDARDWLGRAVAQHPETNFAIAVRGLAVGSVGFILGTDVHRRSAEVGFWVGTRYAGRGIASKALAAIVEHAFLYHDLCRLEALVFAWNPASMRVLEKCGFKLESIRRAAVVKDERTSDAYVYALIRND